MAFSLEENWMEMELGNFRDFRSVCCGNCQLIYFNTEIAPTVGSIRVVDKMNFLGNWHRETRRGVFCFGKSIHPVLLQLLQLLQLRMRFRGFKILNLNVDKTIPRPGGITKLIILYPYTPLQPQSLCPVPHWSWKNPATKVFTSNSWSLGSRAQSWNFSGPRLLKCSSTSNTNLC